MQLKKRHLAAVFTLAVAGLGALFHQKTKFEHEPARLIEYANSTPSGTGGSSVAGNSQSEKPLMITAANKTEEPLDLTQQIILDALSLHDLRQAMNKTLPPDRRLEHLDFFMQNIGEGAGDLARIAKELETTPDALAAVIRNIALDAVADIRERRQIGIPDVIERFALTFAASQYGHYIGLQADGSIVHTYADQMAGWQEGELQAELHALYETVETAAKREFDALPKEPNQLTEQQAERLIRASLFSSLAYDPLYDDVIEPGAQVKAVDNSWMTEFNKRLAEAYKVRDRIAASSAAIDHAAPVGDFKPR